MRCGRRSRRWGHGSLLEGDGDATERHSETVANGAVRGLRGGEVVLRVVAVLLLELEALVRALGVLLGVRCERVRCEPCLGPPPPRPLFCAILPNI